MVDHGGEPGDHALAAQPLDALVGRGARDAHPRRQLVHREATVGLQLVEDQAIHGVDGRRRLSRRRSPDRHGTGRYAKDARTRRRSSRLPPEHWTNAAQRPSITPWPPAWSSITITRASPTRPTAPGATPSPPPAPVTGPGVRSPPSTTPWPSTTCGAPSRGNWPPSTSVTPAPSTGGRPTGWRCPPRRCPSWRW